jgi:hypothetical protein
MCFKLLTAILSYSTSNKVRPILRNELPAYLQFHDEIHLMFVFKSFQQLDYVRMFQPGNKTKERVNSLLEEMVKSYSERKT